jgi:hypothetical protein
VLTKRLGPGRVGELSNDVVDVQNLIILGQEAFENRSLLIRRDSAVDCLSKPEMI